MHFFSKASHTFRTCTSSSIHKLLLLAVLLLAGVASTSAQSTFGTILGVVQDASGAVVSGAKVTLTNTGTTAQRIATTDGAGEFTFSNIDVGAYTVTITATGFEKFAQPNIVLTARETRRVEAKLQLGAESQTMTVTAEAQNVIQTEVSNLAETKLGEELVNLPVAVYSRSTGSTSPIDTLTTEAGVQTDDSGNLSIMGAPAPLLSVTVDGISSVGVEYSGPINEMFPSFNSIEEIRVSESNNNAEFSGVADITTISKSGTNLYHGGVFENIENTAFNAGDPFTGQKTKIIMNDFGGTLGGPVKIPHLYDGHDKSFFFISYEALRLPRETPLISTVPTDAMRTGNVQGYLASQGVSQVYNPDGTPIADPTAVPVTPIAANMLNYLFPKQNYGDASTFSDNYRTDFPAPISTNQGDVRVDQTLTPKQSIFARFSYKNRQITSAPDINCGVLFCQSAGSPLDGPYNTPEIDEGLTVAYNYVFTQKLLNEFRGGYNAQHTSTIPLGYNTATLLNNLGIYNETPQPDLAWPEEPLVAITGFMSPGGGNPTVQRSQIVQLLDNVTWTKGRHTFKFGADFKRLTDYDTNVFGNYSSGWFVFDQSSPVGSTIGDPFTSFLLGYPDWTGTSTINKPEMNGIGHSYAFFAQDDWKITANLTLNLGLRWELHPPLKETNYNTAFFDPTYTGPGTDGSTVSGAVIVPNQTAIGFESSDFTEAISPTPTLTAKQAGVPETLRFTDKNDWGPRIGFAWRPFGNDKTVLRGGWGRFIETPLGFSLVSGWAVSASYLGFYNQAYEDDGVTPQLSLSNPGFANGGQGATGTAEFQYAFPIHYKDPSVQQWNMTLEQDLGHNLGLRLSYTGSHGSNLETMVDLNQVAPNTVGYYNNVPDQSQAPTSSPSCDVDGPGSYEIADYRPYPCWSIIQSVENLAESNYHSATVEVSRKSGKNLTFDASYMWTRDLSNAAGATPTSFAVSGGSLLTNRFHPGLDYGNVIYDRKHRFMATYLYQLPVGKGQRWLNTSSLLNTIIGNWQLGGITVLQTGPFLTPYQATVDPANTNILITNGQTRTDQVGKGSALYAAHRNAGQWLNPNAFPYLNLQTYDPVSQTEIGIGRFANAPVGGVVGPGTAIFSMSLRKDFAITEHTRFYFDAEAANVFNHRNYEPPNMQADSPSFGQIPELQTAEGAGPRSLQLAARINF